MYRYDSCYFFFQFSHLVLLLVVAHFVCPAAAFGYRRTFFFFVRIISRAQNTKTEKTNEKIRDYVFVPTVCNGKIAGSKITSFVRLLLRLIYYRYYYYSYKYHCTKMFSLSDRAFREDVLPTGPN